MILYRLGHLSSDRNLDGESLEIFLVHLIRRTRFRKDHARLVKRRSEMQSFGLKSRRKSAVALDKNVILKKNRSAHLSQKLQCIYISIWYNRVCVPTSQYMYTRARKNGTSPLLTRSSITNTQRGISPAFRYRK